MAVKKLACTYPSRLRLFEECISDCRLVLKVVPFFNEKGNFLNLQPSPITRSDILPHRLGWRLTWFVIWTCSGRRGRKINEDEGEEKSESESEVEKQPEITSSIVRRKLEQREREKARFE